MHCLSPHLDEARGSLLDSVPAEAQLLSADVFTQLCFLIFFSRAVSVCDVNFVAVAALPVSPNSCRLPMGFSTLWHLVCSLF